RARVGIVAVRRVAGVAGEHAVAADAAVHLANEEAALGAGADRGMAAGLLPEKKTGGADAVHRLLPEDADAKNIRLKRPPRQRLRANQDAHARGTAGAGRTGGRSAGLSLSWDPRAHRPRRTGLRVFRSRASTS